MLQDLRNLKDSVADIPGEAEERTKIPPQVALSDKIKDYENENIVFAFVQYKQNHCEIHKLEKPDAKRLTEEFRKINLTQAKNILCQEASGIACKPIHKSGTYTSLFDGLPADVQLLEIDYTRAGRIFGYLVENIFNIVLIKKKHL